MKLNPQLLVFFIFMSTLCMAQNMKEGFTYLETGKYRQAEIFFKNILTEYPTNKTAKLCFGRAVGLNGDSKNAVIIFTDLLKKYPTDFEIKLNYAESLLWDKNFIKAKGYYQNLVKENAKSFPALLGYANTLSNLKIYDQALELVNKSLVVSPGNANALTSKKYIYLGYANQYVQKRAYSTAISLLKENLLLFKNNIETLQNLANVYLISENFIKAEKTYTQIGTSPQHEIIALNGLALVAHLKGKDKEALKVSFKAMSSIKDETPPVLRQQTKERHIQALIWNREYADAQKMITKLLDKYPNKNWVLSLRATLNVYKSNFKSSITDYNHILKNDSISFDGNLGKANALKALRLYDEAYMTANRAATFYNNQKDIANFLKTLDKEFTPFIESNITYSSDNGNNEATSFYTGLSFPTSTKLKFNANYTYRTTQNSILNLDATSHSFLGGISYQLLPTLVFNGNLGITTAATNLLNYSQFLADISLNIKPFKLQNLDIGYKRELQDFNADLLSREIIQNNYYVNYSLNTNVNFGWFSQYYYTSQNDSNARNLLFTSAYYTILNSPILKAGINYQYITFKNQVPSVYFSPKEFNAVEVFIDLLRDENSIKKHQWFYGLNAATGFQYIENTERQNTYRIQGKLGYKFSERSIANLFMNHSNIASVTAAGFKFTEIGIRFKWYLTKQPYFLKK